jgi:hypothetical protein
MVAHRVQALRDKEQQRAAGCGGVEMPLIRFEDFHRFQMLITYHLHEVERALSLFGTASVAAEGGNARFGAFASRVQPPATVCALLPIAVLRKRA